MLVDRGESRKSTFRTIDVARRAGYSVQQIRDLERDGVLPPVPRSPSGYRGYTAEHVHAASAYRAFAAGVGPVDAKTLMRAANRGPGSELPALLDEAHARLHTERRDVALARKAAAAITAEPIDEARPSDARASPSSPTPSECGRRPCGTGTPKDWSSRTGRRDVERASTPRETCATRGSSTSSAGQATA